MSEVTGIPYFTIIKAAVIPAILYYLGVFCMVHFIALKRGVQPIDRAQRPPLRKLIRHAYFFLPFLIVLLLLAYGYSPSKAAFHTIWMTLILSFFDRKTWLTPRKMLDICFGSLVNCALIAAVLAGSGMVVGVLTRTGVALSFGSILVSVSLNSLLLVLVLVFLVVSVLGTGIPTTASYIIAVTVGAYALSKFGVAPLAAHLFVFYYAVLADMTPPGCGDGLCRRQHRRRRPHGHRHRRLSIGDCGVPGTVCLCLSAGAPAQRKPVADRGQRRFDRFRSGLPVVRGDRASVRAAQALAAHGPYSRRRISRLSAQIDVILGLCAGIGGFAWSFIDSRATAARRPSASPGS